MKCVVSFSVCKLMMHSGTCTCDECNKSVSNLVFCAHPKVCIVFSYHIVMMCILNHSPLIRYENIHGHMNVVGTLSL